MDGGVIPRPSGRIEAIDDRVRQASEILQHIDDVGVLKRKGFAETYKRGIIHLGFRSTLPRPPEYSLIVGALPPAPDNGLKIPLYTYPGDGNELRMSLDSEKPAMLPRHIEMMETPKEVVPSFVWLQRLEDFSFGYRKRVYEFMPLEFPRIEVVGAIYDGEINFVWPRQVMAVSEDSSENVEACAERVDIGAHFHVERERQRLLLRRYNVEIGTVRIRISKRYIDVEPEPIGKSVPLGWEMGYGPINCSFGLEEIVTHERL